MKCKENFVIDYLSGVKISRGGGVKILSSKYEMQKNFVTDSLGVKIPRLVTQVLK